MSARRAFCHDCTHSRADTDAVWVWRPSPPHGGSGVVVALLDLREELFELPAELLTRRERLFAREQRLVGATTERVVQIGRASCRERVADSEGAEGLEKSAALRIAGGT